MAYAKNTDVSVDRSKSEIEKVLARYGARGFAYAQEEGKAMVGFRILNHDARMLAVRMILELPDPASDEFCTTPTGKPRGVDAARQAWEQACRSRWRALLLIIKAKLEACELGITTIEREFMADVMLPNGRTIGEMVEDQRAALEQGGSIKLLPSR